MKKLALMLTVLAFALSPAVAQHPPNLSGTLIVLNKGGDDASFIDLASGAIVATLPTGRGPHELAVSDDGRWAISTDYAGGDSLTVFDVAGPSVARTIDLADYPRPHGIALLPGGQEVIVTSEASDTLVIVNFHTGAIVRSIGTEQAGSHMLALVADGSVAYSSNGGSDSISVLDVTNGRFLRSLPVAPRPEAIGTTAAGDEVWVGSNDEGLVTVIAPATGEQIARWSGFDWPYRILFSADERYALVPDLNQENLRIFDARDKTRIAELDLAGGRPQGLILHPDDRTLFQALSGRDRVLVIDVESQQVLGEYPTGTAPDGIGYSPLVVGDNGD